MTEMQVWQREIQATAIGNRDMFAVTEDTARIADLSRRLEQSESSHLATVAEYTASAARYEQRIMELGRSLRGQLAEAQEQHRADIEIISDALLSEAEERDWCAEFDEFVEAVNRRLTVEIAPREREHDVEFVLRFTVQVKAIDQDAATDAAWDYARAIESFADRAEGTDGSSQLNLD